MKQFILMVLTFSGKTRRGGGVMFYIKDDCPVKVNNMINDFFPSKKFDFTIMTIFL
jgi:hypothetical protein